MSLEHLILGQKVKKYSKKNEDVTQGYRSQSFKGIFAGQN